MMPLHYNRHNNDKMQIKNSINDDDNNNNHNNNNKNNNRNINNLLFRERLEIGFDFVLGASKINEYL